MSIPALPKPGTVLKCLGLIVLGLPLLYLMLLLGWNTLPYYAFRSDHPFFIEKYIAYGDPVWRVAFYIHITGGLVCLFSPILQFSRVLLFRFPALHRKLGKAYVHSTLWFTVPPGLYLALYAKGGTWGPILFTLLGVLHFYFTWFGWRLMKGDRPDMRRHAAWMIRSYCMAQTAISFRIFHTLLVTYGVENFYVHALWLSVVVNLIIAEGLIALTLNRRRKTT